MHVLSFSHCKEENILWPFFELKSFIVPIILGEKEFKQSIFIPVKSIITKLLKTLKFVTLTRITFLVIGVTISKINASHKIISKSWIEYDTN